MVNDFQCRFFGPELPSGNCRSQPGIAEYLCAVSDEEAMLEAWSLYRRQPGRQQGFELWQGDRLVFRHVTTASQPILKRVGSAPRKHKPHDRPRRRATSTDGHFFWS